MQMQEEPETAACMPATMNVPSAAAEVLIAPATPDRMAPARRASAMHLLHDMPNLPAMGMLLTRPAASQKVRLAPVRTQHHKSTPYSLKVREVLMPCIPDAPCAIMLVIVLMSTTPE